MYWSLILQPVELARTHFFRLVINLAHRKRWKPPAMKGALHHNGHQRISGTSKLPGVSQGQHLINLRIEKLCDGEKD